MSSTNATNHDSNALLVVDNVTKAFGGEFGFRAVDQVSFTVERGGCYGFIGPNGAGKTTTLRMIATLMDPDEGEITVGGFNSIDDPIQVRQLLGYMPDDAGMYEGVRVWEYLEFFADSYRIPGGAVSKVVADVMELTDLGVIRDKLTSTLSKGMRQRLLLAKTLLHDPQLLVLDEPAAGLDPRARIELRMLIKELRKMGKTIIVSSHILTELADVCDSVGIIEQGRMIASGRVEDLLKRNMQQLRVRLRLLSEVGGGELDRCANLLRTRERVEGVGIENGQVEFTLQDEEANLPDLLAWLLNHGVKIVGVSQEQRNLEDIFLTITRGAVA